MTSEEYDNYLKIEKNKEIETRYIKLMQAADSTDVEESHSKADEILCDMLKELGFRSIVHEFNTLEKWYS